VNKPAKRLHQPANEQVRWKKWNKLCTSDIIIISSNFIYLVEIKMIVECGPTSVERIMDCNYNQVVMAIGGVTGVKANLHIDDTSASLSLDGRSIRSFAMFRVIMSTDLPPGSVARSMLSEGVLLQEVVRESIGMELKSTNNYCYLLFDKLPSLTGIVIANIDS
jgi:hypothetical protein